MGATGGHAIGPAGLGGIVHPNTAPTWPVWRLVAARVASLHEIDTHWTLSDVLDANEALDVLADVGAS